MEVKNKGKYLVALVLTIIIVLFIIGFLTSKKDENKPISELILLEGEDININDYIDIEDAVIDNSNEEAVVIDEDGYAKAIKPGTAQITIKNEEKEIKLEIIVKDENEYVEVYSITLEHEHLDLEVGKSEHIIYKIWPDTASNKNVVWSSSNEKVAKVENGKITGISAGEATITAKTYNNREDSINVRVIDNKDTRIDEFSFTNVGSATFVGNKKELLLIYDKSSKEGITCTSKDPIIAETEYMSGLCYVTGRSYGTTTITAKMGKKETSTTITVKNNPITTDDFLKVEGTKFVKVSNGNTVLLRGFNLGEWLSRAISLSPISKASSYTDAYEREYADNNVQINYILTKRFGEAKTFDLNESYYSNYITASDLDVIASTGANVVRVPVEWSYFVDLKFDNSKRDENNNYKYTYTMLSGDKLEQRLKHLDWIVDECGKRGIYVIFDLHVVDGGQNNGGIRSRRGGYTFFDNDNSKKNAIEIWKIIANRFNNNPTVAAYDLLNEPAGNEEKLMSFYKDAYNAIRSIESSSRYNHIIILETPMKGATGHSIKGLKKPGEYGLSNVAYSIHDYFTSNNSILPNNTVEGEGTADDVKNAIKEKVDQDVLELKQYKIPIFIGETNFLWKDVDDVWKYAMSYYDSNLISYTFWNYKTAKSTSYGLVYNLDKNSNNLADLVNDSYNTINNKFKMNTNNGNYTLNKYYSVIRNNFAGNNEKSKLATANYNCKVGGKLITTIKSYSNDGETILGNVNVNNDILFINKISPTGVICDGSACQTIEIICDRKGKATISVTSSNNRVTTSTININ